MACLVKDIVAAGGRTRGQVFRIQNLSREGFIEIFEQRVGRQCVIGDWGKHCSEGSNPGDAFAVAWARGVGLRVRAIPRPHHWNAL